MPLTSTTRAGTASSSRYIEVYRGSTFVSRHTSEFEAVESAVDDAEANGDGDYELRYPNKMLRIEMNGAFPAPPPTQSQVVISSINGGQNVQNNQSAVNIVGSGFGTQQGTATYNSIPLVITQWDDTLVEVAWPDIPFNPDYIAIDMNTSLTVIVEDQLAQSSDSRNATTIPNANAYYGIITSIPTNSIYENDTGIELGVDKGYIRFLSGTADIVDVSTGLLSGVSVGAVVEYNIYDVSDIVWANGAIESF